MNDKNDLFLKTETWDFFAEKTSTVFFRTCAAFLLIATVFMTIFSPHNIKTPTAFSVVALYFISITFIKNLRKKRILVFILFQLLIFFECYRVAQTGGVNSTLIAFFFPLSLFSFRVFGNKPSFIFSAQFFAIIVFSYFYSKYGNGTLVEYTELQLEEKFGIYSTAFIITIYIVLMINNQSKKWYKLVLESQASLVDASKKNALAELSGGVAHEINNPLMIINGANTIISKEIKKHLEEGKELNLERIQKQTEIVKLTTKRISMITRGLLSISRDKSNADKSEFIIGDVIEDVLALCQEKIKINQIDFQYAKDDELHKSVVKGDRVQVSQVLLNLIVNSIYETKKLDNKWIKLSYKIQDNHIDLILSDSGSGIPLDIQEKMFDPFFTTKPIGEGTGLGLSISQSMMRFYDGDLRYNPETENTTFEVVLKLVG